jgi:hypothetical protein
VPAPVLARPGVPPEGGLERLARVAERLPGPLPRLVARHGLEYWGLARRTGWRGALAGYPRYLQHRWDLAYASQVPLAGLGRMARLAGRAVARAGRRRVRRTVVPRAPRASS